MDWKQWLEEQRKNMPEMKVERVSLSDTNPWGMQEKGDHFGRPDKAFFALVGAAITAVSREVKSWTQPLLEETGVGVIVLVYEYDRALLQAKQEPGNDSGNRILLAPTLQASKSNLEAAHGGRKPPRAELIRQDSPRVSLCQDGGRFLNKRNEYVIVEAQEDIVLLANERWFTLEEIRQIILAGDANEHLIQALMVWAALP